MKAKWVIGAVLVGSAVVGMYFVIVEKQPQPASPAAAQVQAPKAEPAGPATPVVLANVVDVLDMEPLLDPPPIPPATPSPTGVVLIAMDDEPAPVLARPSTTPAFIPPAATDGPEGIGQTR